MRKLIAIAAILLSGTLYAQTAKHRIVMELTSSDTLVWKATISSINHLKTAWGDNVQIELVAHGAGISILLNGKTTQQGAIKKLIEKGVRFEACANTLKDHHIDQSQVIPEAGVVPLGLGEVILKQESGWSYIKAGN